MKVLVTGAKGFVGKNVCLELKNRKHEVFEYDVDSTLEELKEWASKAEYVIHLAGVNRPKDEKEFIEGNADFSATLCNYLKEANSKAKISMTSSIQAALGNAYGNSKIAGENALFNYQKETKNKVYVFRLPNIYGKWARPNYNSMVATFCNNIACGLDITINDANAIVPLLYIDDLVKILIDIANGNEPSILTKEELKDLAPKATMGQIKKACPKGNTYYKAEPVDKASVGQVADILRRFKESRSKDSLEIANMADGFEKKLYSTFLSYLPEDDFAYNLKMNVDERGSFTEILKSCERGQVSVNVAKPGITKGNHWHHSKNEKFIVVSGKASIKFRKIGTDKVIEYIVDENEIKVVDIPTGYTHNITNIGEKDLVTIMWANEKFDPENPDTFFEEV